MDWTFSLGWVMVGLLIFAAGGAMVFFYKPIADNFVGGIGDYDKVKLVGLIVAGVGIIVMTNLHTLILGWLVSVIFGGV